MIAADSGHSSFLKPPVVTEEDALFITVTGRGTADRGTFDYVWGSNDPDIDRKLRAGQFDRHSPGTVRLHDEVADAIAALEGQINEQVRPRVTVLVSERQRILVQVQEVARREGIDSPRFAELQRELTGVDGHIAAQLGDIGAVTGSAPRSDLQTLEGAYVFYRPIVYRQEGEDIYFRGAVRMGVSTQGLRAELASATRTLLIQTAIIALIAAVLGLGLAALMAFTMKPGSRDSRTQSRVDARRSAGR